MPNPPKNSWICDEERTLVDSPVMRIIERLCHSSEDGRKHRFYLFRSRDWCNIIPITEDGKVVLVKQYRIGISDHTIEVPGGVMDPSDPDPMAAAIREMTEETGYEPVEGFRCVNAGWSFANPAIQDNRVHSFIVGPVRKTREQKLDTGEMIETAEIPIEEIPARILSGEISHALMLNTFFFATIASEEGSSALKRELKNFSSRD